MALTVAEKDLKKRELFLEGNILKGVLTVCVPMAAFQLLNELFRVFDLAITARINPESVAAVSFFNQLNNSVTAVGTGLSIGAGILIAGFYGAADYENVKKTVNTTFFLAVGGALLLAISLILSGKWVLRLANTPEELVEIGWNYYRVIMVNLVFVFFNNVYVAIEKARGNGGRILGVNLLMAAAKFTLSGVFVLIFRKGVVMIAFSTLLSNLLVTLIGIYSLRDPKDVFGISLEYIRMDRLFIKKLFGISLPVMAEKFAFSTGKVVVNSVGVDYGTQTVGALGVSNSISALSTVPAGSIGDGGASIIRQNIGSGKKDRALKVFKSVFLVDVAWGTLGFLLTWIFLNPILSVFSGGDANVLNSGSSLLFITMPQVFMSMPFGQAVGAVFFILVFFAALTSAISFVETIVSVFQDQFGWKRIPICIGTCFGAIVIGLAAAWGFGWWSGVTIFGMNISDFLDFFTNSILMPISALFTCIFLGFIVGTSVVADEVKLSSRFRSEKMFIVITKWIAPVCIVAILVTSILSAAGLFTI